MENEADYFPFKSGLSSNTLRRRQFDLKRVLGLVEPEFISALKSIQ